jgi:ribosomal protein S15
MKESNFDFTQRDSLDEQAEMVRRVLSIENASASQMKKFNTARAVELFQRDDQDTGSAEVQVAVMSVKIIAIKEHLAKNPKDKSTKRRLDATIGKRGKMLKYLRRKNLPVFVQTCRLVGVEPDTIRC